MFAVQTVNFAEWKELTHRFRVNNASEINFGGIEMKLNLTLSLTRYAIKMLTMPLTTNFEIHGNRVNRFAFTAYTLGLLSKK